MTPPEITGPVATALADFVVDELQARLEDPSLGPPHSIYHEDSPETTGTSRPEEGTVPTNNPRLG